MSRTVRDLAASVGIAANLGGLTPNAVRWVQEAYEEWCATYAPAHLRKETDVIVPAAVTTGTVTVVRGSSSVTGNAAALAVWSSSLNDRWFRAGTNWYRIAAASSSGMVLETEFAEDDVTAGGYAIVPRYVELPEDARWVIDIRCERLGYGLEKLSQDELNRLYTDRSEIRSTPQVYAPGTPSFRGRNQIEVYPCPEDTELLRIGYYPVPQELDEEAFLPSLVEGELLKIGAIQRALEAKASIAADANQPEVAAVYTNRAAQYRTHWERAMAKLTVSSQNLDVAGVVRVRKESGRRVSRERFWRTEDI